MALRIKSFGKKQFSVTGCPSRNHLQPDALLPVALIHGCQRIFGHKKRLPLVGRIKGSPDIFFFIYEYEFGSGAAGINAKISSDYLIGL
jgi:hypothetical protein